MLETREVFLSELPEGAGIECSRDDELDARSLEDGQHLFDPLLRRLVQRKRPCADDFDRALGLCLQKFLEATGAEAAFALQLEGASDNMRVQLHRASGSKRSAGPLVGRVLSTRALSFLREAAAGRPFWSKTNALQPALPSAALALGIHSLIGVPLFIEERVFGALIAVNKRGAEGEEFPVRDILVLQHLAYFASLMLRGLYKPEAKLSEPERCRCLARLARCATIHIREDEELDEELLAAFGEELLQQFQVLPLKRNNGDLRIVTSDPTNFHLQELLELKTGLTVGEKLVADQEQIDQAIRRRASRCTANELRSEVIAQFQRPFERGELAEEVTEYSAPIIRLANHIIREAYEQGASDIHLEPQEEELVVRYRVDGVCAVRDRLPKGVHTALVNRLKIMTRLNIAEHRLPQDGRLMFRHFEGGCDIDLRVSVAPFAYGEGVVMRVLDRERSTMPLPALGFSSRDLTRYQQAIRAPYGMVLHTGPTGSGKSMSMYSALHSINSPELKILTAEDPIEYSLAGINQLEVAPDIGLTFAAALRCFLRQDPDIMLVGEIRDLETARIAVEAALTGHKLFSTLHTNDAPSAATRLLEIGIEPFLIANSLLAICAQRLLRRLCPCKSRGPLSAEDARIYEELLGRAPPAALDRRAGCDDCKQTGFKGRIGVYELMTFDDAIRLCILSKDLGPRLKELARAAGMRTLFEQSIDKVDAGITDLEEVTRAVIPDAEPPAAEEA